MECKICNHTSSYVFNGIILNKYDIKYFYCKNCAFLQTEEPFWLEEAYGESINLSDTGYMQRNLVLRKKITILLAIFFDKGANYLDYAGGYGVFVRMMRDIGFNFYWDDKYTKNLFSKGFEYQIQNHFEAVTSFESFEHFIQPLEEIEKMLKISRNIIFTTEVLAPNIPKTEDWWYYGLEHGQHISFYSTKTLVFIAKKYNLKYINMAGLHIFTDKNISNLSLKILKFSKFGLHNIIEKTMKSKTWDDHLIMKSYS